MEFRILGPVEVRAEGRVLPVPSAKQRAILAILLLHANRVVASTRLIDDLWAGEPPETAAKTLRVHVSHLRKALRAGSEDGIIVTGGSGYLITVQPGELDLDRFESLVREAGEARAGGDVESAAAALRRALELWRGPALADLAEERFAQPEIARLEELRLSALEELADAHLDLGRHAEVVGDLEALVARYPLRERLRVQLMLALYRSGRQADALRVYRETRHELVEELGIEPGRELQELERAILRHDTSLDAARPDPPALPATPQVTAAPPTAQPAQTRKIVTVLFSDIVDSTPLGERVDPEVLSRVKARYFERVREVLERHGGTVEKFIGDAVMAVFGVPRVHEDDAIRATRAAMELRDAVHRLNAELERDYAVRLSIRTGVNTGEVIAGDPGAGQAFLSGDPVNVAARLEQAAQPGEVLLGEATYRLVRDAVAVEPIDSLALKGKADPMTAHRLVGLVTGVPRRLRSELVGRERELGELRALFDKAVERRSCGLVTIVGPAGIGKSRLAEEFVHRLAGGAAILRARCLPYGEGIALLPLALLLQHAAGIEPHEQPARVRAEIAALVGGEDGERAGEYAVDLLAGGGAARTEELYWVVRRVLESVARLRPVVVCLDDVHLADATVLDFVEYLLWWSRDAPILVCCLGRPELFDIRREWAVAGGGSTPVLLGALDSDQSRRLVANLLGGGDPPEASRIAVAAAGNPLFVEEMLRMLLDEGVLRREGGRWEVVGELKRVAIPPTIQALLAARLDRLAPGERLVLERASVVGEEFGWAAVSELAPDEVRAAIARHLQALVRKDLVAPGRSAGEDAFRFSHTLVRDAAYEALPKETRAQLHERCARWLEREQGAEDELVGYHLEQAFRYHEQLGPVDERERALAEEAGERLLAAGQRSFGRGEMPAAAGLLGRAAGLLPERADARLDLLPDLAWSLFQVGDAKPALSVLEDAISAAEATGDRRRRAHARTLRFLLDQPMAAGWTGEMLSEAEEALAVFREAGDERGLARAYFLSATAHLHRRRWSDAAAAVELGAQHAERAGDDRLRASLTSALGVSYYCGPTPVEEAAAWCEQALERWSRNLRVQALAAGLLGALRAMQGRFEEARELHARREAILVDLGLEVQRAAGRAYSATIELLAGDYVEAERQLRWALRKLEPTGARDSFAQVALLLAEALAGQGREEEAEQAALLAEAQGLTDEAGVASGWRVARARAFTSRGDLAEAEQLAREAVDIAATTDEPNLKAGTHATLAAVQLAAGRRDEAADQLEAAVALYEGKGNLVAAGRARAELAGLLDSATRAE